MKKISTLFLASVFVIFSQAQISVPNGTFETWSTLSYSYPTNYPINVNEEDYSFKTETFPLTKTTGYHGSYGVQLESTTQMGIGYLCNYQPGEINDYNTWHGGVPYTGMPTGMRGYYKYNVASGDNGGIIVAFSKNGSNIGSYLIPLGGLHSDYTLFDVDFTPALTMTPDSVLIAVASSWPTAVTGSILALDSISFKGVASQPVALNGDFEEWVDETKDVSPGWLYNDYQAVKQTTDAHGGQYAIELTTGYDSDGLISAQIMSNAYYPNNCDGNCSPIGGIPFTETEGSFAFYYKYVPQGNDTAAVSLFFKKAGNMIGYAEKKLTAASSYSYETVPFSLYSVPDSVVIQIQTSFGVADSDLTKVGSDLKIDDVSFVTPSSVLENEVGDANLIYPNPVSSGFYINKDLTVGRIIITNMIGAVVQDLSGTQYYVDVSKLPKGVYGVQIQGDNHKTYSTKFVKE